MSGKIYQTVEESRLNEMHRALFISDKSYIMSPSWLLFLVNWLVFESWFFQFFFSEFILGYFPKQGRIQDLFEEGVHSSLALLQHQ